MNPAKKPSLPVDIYCRVSQTRGRLEKGDSFQSTRQQEERCRAQIAADGLLVGEVFTDLDESGGKEHRPAFDQMMSRIQAGVSGGVCVYDLSRFGRNTRHVLDGIEAIESRGGVFISCVEKLDTSTASGRFVLTMFAALRELEREQSKERVAVAQRDAVGRGIHISRHVPPGYERGEGKLLVPHPKHGKTISEVFEMAATGKPAAEIARFLNERGVPSGENGHWASNRIKRLLANPVYLGEARYGTITKADAHEPLTDRTTWLRAQRDQRATVKPDATYLLSGIVRCAACRHAMRPQAARGKTIATYRCVTDTASGRCPHPSSISMQRLEDFVYEQFADRVLTRDAAPVAEQDDSDSLERIEDARRALTELEEIKDTLRPAAYAAALDSALGELEEAEGALTKVPVKFDMDEAVRTLMPVAEESAARIASGERPLDLMTDKGKELLRSMMAGEIQAVFVRPAASRAHNLPIEDRVRIVWTDEEPLELPRRGTTFEPRAYEWPESARAV